MLKHKGAKQSKAFLKQFNKLSREEKKTEIDKKFKKLVSHVYEHVPYYSRVMKNMGMKPGDISGIEMLTEFPVLTKEIIRHEKEALRADNYPLEACFSGRSGGTTGEPIRTVLNKNAYYIEHYAYWQGLEWMGWKQGEKIVKLFGGSLGFGNTTFKSTFKSMLINQVFLPAFELKKSNAHKYLSALHSSSTLIGYSSAIYELSQLAKELGYSTQVRNVFVTAEQLPETWAIEISSVFGCEVKSFYGCGEVNSLGFQLNQGGFYKIPIGHVKIESITHDNFNSSLALTSLHNYAQPLIRYINGDVGALNEDDNTYIEKLHGRTADFFKTSDGKLISGSIAPHSILITNLPVKKYQFIQRKFDEIEFRYSKDKGELTVDQMHGLTAIYTSHFNYEVKITFSKTSNFIKSKSEKHRLIVIEV